MKTSACVSSIKLVPSGYDEEHRWHTLYIQAKKNKKHTITANLNRATLHESWLKKTAQFYLTLFTLFVFQLIRGGLDNELFINRMANIVTCQQRYTIIKQ